MPLFLEPIDDVVRGGENIAECAPIAGIETRFAREVEHFHERFEVAVNVEQSAGGLQFASLDLRHHAEEFFERTKASRQRDEGVGHAHHVLDARGKVGLFHVFDAFDNGAPLGGEARTDDVLVAGYPLGVSNEYAEGSDCITISTRKGALVVVETVPDTPILTGNKA